jgi:hypothetical protein
MALWISFCLYIYEYMVIPRTASSIIEMSKVRWIVQCVIAFATAVVVMIHTTDPANISSVNIEVDGVKQNKTLEYDLAHSRNVSHIFKLWSTDDRSVTTSVTDEGRSNVMAILAPILTILHNKANASDALKYAQDIAHNKVEIIRRFLADVPVCNHWLMFGLFWITCSVRPRWVFEYSFLCTEGTGPDGFTFIGKTVYVIRAMPYAVVCVFWQLHTSTVDDLANRCHPPGFVHVFGVSHDAALCRHLKHWRRLISLPSIVLYTLLICVNPVVYAVCMVYALRTVGCTSAVVDRAVEMACVKFAPTLRMIMDHIEVVQRVWSFFWQLVSLIYCRR